MTTSSCGKLVSYCDCTGRQANIGGIFVSRASCDWCHGVVPDDKAIYMVLKDHVEQIQFLGTKRGKARPKRNKKRNKNGSGDVVEALQHLPYREDVDKLYKKYGFQVICASARVLLGTGPLEQRHLSTASWEDCLPAAEPDSDVSVDGADREIAGEPEPDSAAEKAPPWDHHCEPEVAAGEYRGIKYVEPEAAEQEYMDVQDMEEKPGDSDKVAPDASDDYGNDSASDKPADPEMEAYPAKVCYEVPVEDAMPSDEETREERAQEKKDLICLPFNSQHILMVQLQGILERACFTYAQRCLPALLRRRKWSCAEAVPLHTWMDEFSIIQDTFHTEPSRDLLQSVAEIEDTAVRRTPIDWSRMKKLLDSAVELTEVLQTEEYGDLIKKIRVDVAQAIQDFVHQEEELRNREMDRISREKNWKLLLVCVFPVRAENLETPKIS
ncbi:hypothetical protein AU210_016786 [Fusarium oxysporum f. sp. radicis-cucumerinum]|uniref:Uncharacterized protein n=1 Tax=Fusarium oxysporum f. sp. radicis-cucumerinum TaxID=327505 RepID=A0A2H3FWJ7_FUSOX|nr:hypothetical protein AU210_016786 [Fusarium oxysporum f. sp. radicis-cucumerinum]